MSKAKTQAQINEAVGYAAERDGSIKVAGLVPYSKNIVRRPVEWAGGVPCVKVAGSLRAVADFVNIADGGAAFDGARFYVFTLAQPSGARLVTVR